MIYLIVGLVVFLGFHSVRIVADPWRDKLVARIGESRYKGVLAVFSLAGFALVVYGFGVARETPVLLWSVSQGLRHAASLASLVAFVLLAAAYIPGNHFKARLHHPMVVAVMLWALAHLMSTATVAHLVLFGSFLIWAVLDFVSLQQRDRTAATVYGAGTISATALSIAVGLAAWLAFAFKAHGWLIGINPFG